MEVWPVADWAGNIRPRVMEPDVMEPGMIEVVWNTGENLNVSLADLPKRDAAFAALPELRRHTDCPIVILTAWGQLPMRLQGLDNGADYYLVKPVPLTELSVVLKTQLRRNTSATNWRTDAASQTLIGAIGDFVHLTSREWLFVKALRTSPGQIVDRQELARALGHDPDKYDLRRMDMLVRRLRLKVDAAGLGELPLRTRHGQGYVWDER